MKNAIIFGATSTIAKSVLNKLVSQNYNLYLFARNEVELLEVATNLRVRNPNVSINTGVFDAETSIGLEEDINVAFGKLGTVDLVFIAHGNLPNQLVCEDNLKAARSALQVNGLNVLEICHVVANKLKLQKSGVIAVISSVAGERGRQSNYIYGTAKGMINIYLQGLRNSLYKHNVHVLTIMPGFVDTKMTSEFKKGLLWASPNKVANDIIKAIEKRKNVIYTPWFWKYIMRIIKMIPETKFKKMGL